ncbi:MAG: SRPBCC domain-containing protein [Ferruginibacter sp.]
MQTENNTTAGLKKVNFSIDINAPKDKVWNSLWDDENYRSWTKAFSEGSYAVSDWNEGSKILFLDGKGSGMYSTIAKKMPNEEMSFRHIGEIKDGKEQPLDEKTKAWSGGLETYTLKESGGVTTVNVELDVPRDFMEYFTTTFPKALLLVKDISENKVTVEATVKAAVEKVWEFWSSPEHITQWCNASDDWHTPRAENELWVGGRFLTRMESKDGSMGFDFNGVYNNVKTNELIEYTIEGGRKVKIIFKGSGNETRVTETFDPENENSIELQRGGWQAILDNFKKYTESKN